MPIKHACISCQQPYPSSILDSRQQQRTPRINANQQSIQSNQLTRQERRSQINSWLLFLTPLKIRWKHKHQTLTSHNLQTTLNTGNKLRVKKSHRRIFGWQPMDTHTAGVTIHLFGDNATHCNFQDVLIKQSINLNPAQLDKLRAICSQNVRLQDNYFSDISKNSS